MACFLKLFARVLLVVSGLVAAEFEAIRFLPEPEPCDITLEVSVPAACERKLSRDQTYAFWKANLEFHFGCLTEAQWKILRQRYTAPWAGPAILSGRTPAFDPYDAARRYRLTDFLPVTIRGLCDYYFSWEEETLPVGQPLPPPPPAAPHLYHRSVLVPNCWSTVYETLRDIMQCRNDDTDLTHDVFSTDDMDAQVWLEAATNPVQRPYEEAQRGFGDIMFIFLRDKQMKRAILQHAVIFVDQDIVFEKAGTGDKNPYRLIDVATVEEEWKPTRLGGMYEWDLRRPDLCNRRLKTFADQFSLLSQEPDRRWPQFWTWPKDLQRRYALGVADNPRVPGETLGLTLLKARHYGFRRSGKGFWEPYRQNPGLRHPTILV